jgi:hypothetical protein
MKTDKKIIWILFFILSSNFLVAQKEKGQSVLTLGVGAGIVATFSYNGIYDYAFADKFSVGLGVNNASLYSLYRTNIGARALYHFGKSTNWDMYTGIRLGASIWSGSGTHNYDGLFSFSAGQVLPSVQVIGGVRYLAYDWLGLNCEAAIGSPYWLSVGLSCKLSNTKEGYAQLKDAYEAEAPLGEGETVPHSLLQPVQKKNIIKIALGTILIAPGMSYERYLTNRFALEVGGSVNFAGLAQSNSVNSETGKFSEDDSTHIGVKAYGMVKYYITAKRNAIPKGWYVGATINYIQQTTRVHVMDLDSMPSPISFDYEKKQVQFSGGSVLGYKITFGKHFCMDAFAGARFGPTQLKSVKYYSADANEAKFISTFGGHLTPLSTPISPFAFRISFGYMF